MKYEIEFESYDDAWAVVATDCYGNSKILAAFQDIQLAEAFHYGLTLKAQQSVAASGESASSVTYSTIGLAELQVKFDGPIVRITIEHDGDDEVTLTKPQFRRMLSMWQAMAHTFL